MVDRVYCFSIVFMFAHFLNAGTCSIFISFLLRLILKVSTNFMKRYVDPHGRCERLLLLLVAKLNVRSVTGIIETRNLVQP